MSIKEAKKLNREKWEKEFFDRLAEKLDEIFPKTNYDNPEVPSKGNRSEAISFNAFANIIFSDILDKASFATEDNIIKGVIEELEHPDAYKMPFSDSDIEMELIENHREIKRTANRWYKRGRNQALADLKKELEGK